MFHANEQVQALISLRGLVAQLLVGILKQCDADDTLIEAVQSLNGEAADEWFADPEIDLQLKIHLAKVIAKAFEQFAFVGGLDVGDVVLMSPDRVDVLEQVVYQGLKQAIAYMGAPRDGQDKELRWEEIKEILALLDENKWSEVNDLVKRNRSQFAPDQMFDIGQLVTLHYSYVLFTSSAFEQYRIIFSR